MIVKTVHYERLVNLGNFQNEKLGVSVEVEANEDPNDTILRARQMVERGIKEIALARDAELRQEQDTQRRRLARAMGAGSPDVVDDLPF